MTEETTPPRRSIATFLHGKPSGTGPATTPTEPGVESVVPVDDVPASTVEAPASPEAFDIVETPHAQDEAIEEIVLAPEPAHDEWVAEVANEVDVVAPVAITSPAVAAPQAPAPSFLQPARQPAAPSRVPRWQLAVIAGLGLLLLLQVMVADRANLAASASTRPLISAVCGVLRCTLPPWHDPAAFTMLSRDIRPVPGQAGALQVQASFRNDARWVQAWPVLLLSLSDADGRVIGRSSFAPRDYLGANYDPAQHLEPGQSAQVSFRLREPAAATVAFSFEFQ